MSKAQAIFYKQFTPSDLEYTEPQENTRSKNQLIGYVRHNNGQLLLKTDFIKLTSGGVPRQDDYHPDDTKRRYMRVPENDDSRELFDVLRQVDKILGSDETKTRFFGSKAKKYSYTPIVREPLVDEEESPENRKPTYIKLMFPTTYPDGNITTNVFWNKEDGNPPEKQEVNTPDEAMKAVPYLSTNRFIISPVKTWAHQSKMKDPQYGLTFKIIQIETKHGSSGGGINQFLNSNAFIGDEDASPVEQVFQKPSTTQPVEAPGSEQSESESESESESDSEEVAPPPPKKSGKKK
jgi:hypothetical protein